MLTLKVLNGSAGDQTWVLSVWQTWRRVAGAPGRLGVNSAPRVNLNSATGAPSPSPNSELGGIGRENSFLIGNLLTAKKSKSVINSIIENIKFVSRSKLLAQKHI